MLFAVSLKSWNGVGGYKMANKSLLERLQTDVKRHRAPQTENLPSWVNSPQQSSKPDSIVEITKPKKKKSDAKIHKAIKKAKKKKK
jgi:hypothetical protein